MDENQPNWDYQEHERLAKELGERTTKADKMDQILNTKGPLSKRFSYANTQAKYAHIMKEDARQLYDSQIVEASSRQDLAHEQALSFTALAEEYKQSAEKIAKEFGIELPEREMDYFITSVRELGWQDRGVDVSPGVGQTLALKDALTPDQEVEAATYDWLPSRLPREGLGKDIDPAIEEAKSKGQTNLLHYRSGEEYRDQFYHGKYEDKYLPLSDEAKKMIDEVGTENLTANISRHWDHVNFTGYADLRTQLDIISLEEASKISEAEKLPVTSEIHYAVDDRDPYSAGGVSTIRAENADDMKRKLLETLIDERIIRGAVTIDGQKVSLSEFLLGKPVDAKPHDAEADAA